MASEVNPLAIRQRTVISLKWTRIKLLSRWFLRSCSRTPYKGVRQTAVNDKGLYKLVFPFLKSHQVKLLEYGALTTKGLDY